MGNLLFWKSIPSAPPVQHVAVTMSNDTLAILIFLLEGRSPTLPVGAQWKQGPVARAVNHLLRQTSTWTRPATKKNIWAEITKSFPALNQFGQVQPRPVKWYLVSLEELPQERTYRNAWRHDGLRVYHDMPHARKIHLEHVQHQVLEQLGSLDREWMQLMGQWFAATSNADTTSAKTHLQKANAVEARRQELRDMPHTLPVDTAQNIDELKAMWPETLPRWVDVTEFIRMVKAA